MIFLHVEFAYLQLRTKMFSQIGKSTNLRSSFAYTSWWIKKLNRLIKLAESTPFGCTICLQVFHFTCAQVKKILANLHPLFFSHCVTGNAASNGKEMFGYLSWSILIWLLMPTNAMCIMLPWLAGRIDPLDVVVCGLCVVSLSAAVKIVGSNWKDLMITMAPHFLSLCFSSNGFSSVWSWYQFFLSICSSRNSHEAISPDLCHCILTLPFTR